MTDKDKLVDDAFLKALLFGEKLRVITPGEWKR
jgi:hypothetical protein